MVGRNVCVVYFVLTVLMCYSIWSGIGWDTLALSSQSDLDWRERVTDTDIKIAYKTTNTIQQRTKTRNPDTTHDLNKSGVYRMTCKTCNKAYIGQTSRNLTTRCRDHIRYIQTNKPQSAYAQHVLNNIHEYGTPTETITLLKHIKDQTRLIPYEQLFIQAFHQTGNLVPEQQCNETNPLLKLAVDRMPPQP